MSQPQRTATGWSIQLRFGKGRRKRFAMPRLSPDAAEDERLAVARAAALEELAAALGSVSQLDASALLEFAANRETEKGFQSAVRAARQAAANPEAVVATGPRYRTFADVANAWMSGELHEEFRRHVRKKRERSVKSDRTILRALCNTVGSVPITGFTLEDAERAMAALPASLGPGTLRQYEVRLTRVLNLAVYPLKLITHSPIPEGFGGMKGKTPEFPFLYPSEEARLITCNTVPFDDRLMYGFLAREGLRISEAVALTWADIDLERGAIQLDKNKTDTPRSWALGEDVVRALAGYRGGAEDEDLVFPHFVLRHCAERLRDHLRIAGINRNILHRATDERRPLRVHDLRATFVTIALALGRSETWVMDRTGHRSSMMVNQYRRRARQVTELGEHRWFAPLDEALGVARTVARESGFYGNLPGSPRTESCEPPPRTGTVEPNLAGASIPSPLDKSRETPGWHAPHQGVAREAAEQPRSMSAPEVTPSDPVATALAEVEVLLAKAIDRATEDREWPTVRILAAELEARRKSREAQRTAGVTSLESARARKNGDKP